jgi:hypothetical protein
MQLDGNTASGFPSCIWGVWAPSMCKFFIWLMLQNQIWTSDRLHERGWPHDYLCAFCRRSLDTPCHMFQEFPVTRQVWTAIAGWASWPRFLGARWRTGSPMQEWFMTMSGQLESRKARGIKSLVIAVSWSIWCKRNARIFSGKERTIPRLITDIKDEARQWFLVGAKNLGPIVGYPCCE